MNKGLTVCDFMGQPVVEETAGQIVKLDMGSVPSINRHSWKEVLDIFDNTGIMIMESSKGLTTDYPGHLSHSYVYPLGVIEGEKCNRLIKSMDNDFLGMPVFSATRCEGIIEDDGKDPDTECTCHCGHPPCSYCTTQNQYCPECGWEAENA